MASKMLIDATHNEETRVVVCKGSRVEEFDLESQERRQLRGNVYLAKVMRVEPSLQAAFVDYGGNRHGFLAFTEIHPDYYQIPVSDRQELLKEAVDDIVDEEDQSRSEEPNLSDSAGVEKATNEDNGAGANDESGSSDKDGEHGPKSAVEETAAPQKRSAGPRTRSRRRPVAAQAKTPVLHEEADEDLNADNVNRDVENVGAEDAMEEVPVRHVSKRRQYKIQEVIRRRQVILIQVVKEERGTKGAALTTYLSLAGRYCVLMPNTARGGGISRKITNVTDRRRLKSIAGDLKVAEGTGVIVRTAGANRTKVEIKRDFDYLQRLWESIRELTLKSTAPSMIYEEGNLTKRSIRDLYNKEIDEVLIEGETGYREAKAFMKMLMPSHARNVKQYKDTQPLFVRYKIESQLNEMFSPEVTLKSGGYLVINQTEALVAIDVNSGKSTREHNIEDTAYQTNLEAASEVARQLRLRDLAGLVVIDFIDMEEHRNNRAVERRIKESLKTDRARIQVGQISHFGLMEMSRQRIRPSVIEGTMGICSDCQGAGRVRSVSSTVLQIVRALEELAADGLRNHMSVSSSTHIVIYLLNRKRAHIAEIEQKYGIEITISIDETLNGSDFKIEKGPMTTQAVPSQIDTVVQVDTAFEENTPASAPQTTSDDGDAETPTPRRRRRRGRRPPEEEIKNEEAVHADDEPSQVQETQADEADGEQPKSKPKRRRGRRGGRRQRRDDDGAVTAESTETNDEDSKLTESADKTAANGASKSPENDADRGISEIPEASVLEDVAASGPQDKLSSKEDVQGTYPSGDGDTKGEQFQRGGWWQRAFTNRS